MLTLVGQGFRCIVAGQRITTPELTIALQPFRGAHCQQQQQHEHRNDSAAGQNVTKITKAICDINHDVPC